MATYTPQEYIDRIKLNILNSRLHICGSSANPKCDGSSFGAKGFDNNAALLIAMISCYIVSGQGDYVT